MSRSCSGGGESYKETVVPDKRSADPGPIRRGSCRRKGSSYDQLVQQSKPVVMGPGVRRDDSEVGAQARKNTNSVSSYARRSSSSNPSGALNAAALASSTTSSADGTSQPPSRSEASAFSANCIR